MPAHPSGCTPAACRQLLALPFAGPVNEADPQSKAAPGVHQAAGWARAEPPAATGVAETHNLGDIRRDASPCVYLAVLRDSPLSPPPGAPRHPAFRGEVVPEPHPCAPAPAVVGAPRTPMGRFVPPSLKALEAERGFARGGHRLRAQQIPTAGAQIGGRLRFSLQLLFNLPKAPAVESKGAQRDPLQVRGVSAPVSPGVSGDPLPQSALRAEVGLGDPLIGWGRVENGSPQFCPTRVVRKGKPSVSLGNPIVRFCSSSSTFFFSISMFPLSSSSSFHSASPSKALQMAFQTRKPFKEKWAHIPFQAPCQNLPSTLET